MLNWLKAIGEVVLDLMVIIFFLLIAGMVFMLLLFALVFVIDYFQAENLLPGVLMTLIGVWFLIWAVDSVIEAHEKYK